MAAIHYYHPKISEKVTGRKHVKLGKAKKKTLSFIEVHSDDGGDDDDDIA